MASLTQQTEALTAKAEAAAGRAEKAEEEGAGLRAAADERALAVRSTQTEKIRPLICMMLC